MSKKQSGQRPARKPGFASKSYSANSGRGKGKNAGRKHHANGNRGGTSGDGRTSDRTNDRTSGWEDTRERGHEGGRGKSSTVDLRRKAPRAEDFRNNPKRRFKKLIDPLLFVNKAKAQKERVDYVPENTFADFDFEPRINENLKYIGFEEPTPIQDEALHFALQGEDVLGLANTGTGKTAVFLLPMIDRLLKMQKGQQTQLNLIVVPTRELAQQIGDDLRSLSGKIKIRKAVIVGGGSFNKQIKELNANPQIVIATPGRLNDHINKGNIHLANCSCFVLDEVDRMLDMGFVRDIRAIASQIKGDHQTMAFSATMPKEVKEILGHFIKKDFKTVSVKVTEINDHIEQDVISAKTRDEKISTLSELLKKSEFEKVLVFGETKHGVQKLTDKLNKSGISAESIHGNKSQNQRQRALKRFKKEEVSVLVATDVAARGLNIEDVSHVINFDQPGCYEDYIHRIGRTGRAGKYGKALTFVN